MLSQGGEGALRPEEKCALFAKGKRLVNEDLDGAIEAFAAALEHKAGEYGQDVHSDLAPFWLEYGDCLLRSQENDVLGGEANANADGGDQEDDEQEDDQQEGEEEDVDGDAQICWESLETARRCLMLLPDSPRKSKDLRFVHLRLGDFLGLTERFHEATIEYNAALKIQRESDSADLAGAMDILVPLAQMAVYQSRWAEAESAYSEASELAKAQLRGEGTRAVDAARKKVLEDLLQDIEVERQLCSHKSQAVGCTDTSKTDAPSKAVSAMSDTPGGHGLEVVDLGTFGRKRSRAALEVDSLGETSQSSKQQK